MSKESEDTKNLKDTENKEQEVTNETEEVEEKEVEITEQDRLDKVEKSKKSNVKGILISGIVLALIGVGGYAMIDSTKEKPIFEEEHVKMTDKEKEKMEKEANELAEKQIEDSEKETEKAIEEYKNLMNENNELYDRIDIDKFEKLLNDGEEHIVYVGRPTCPQCREFLPMLTNVLSKNNNKIIYLDSDLAKTTKEKAQKQADLIGTVGISEVPTVVKIKDGKGVRMDTEGTTNATVLEEFLK